MSSLPLCVVISLEIFLNDFRWIHWIQWKMSKSKYGMGTRNTPYLITDIFPEVVAKCKFSKQHLVGKLWHLNFGWMTLHIYPYLVVEMWFLLLSLYSYTIALVASWLLFVVAIRFLDFVMNQWIYWIQWNNSINPIPMETIQTAVRSVTICSVLKTASSEDYQN